MRDLVDVFAEAYAKTRNPFGMRRDPRDDYFDGRRSCQGRHCRPTKTSRTRARRRKSK